MVMTAKERRERLKDRVRTSAENKDKKGMGIKSALDLSKVADIPRFEMRGGISEGKAVQNALDLLPFVITQEWYENMRGPSGNATGRKVGELDYKLECAVHRRMGEAEETVLCLNKAFGNKCPMCEMLSEYYDIEEDKRTKEDENMIKFLQPSWRVSYNVFDYDNPDKGIHLWIESSYWLVEDHLLDKIQVDLDGIGVFSDPVDGLIVVFGGKEKKWKGAKYYEAQEFTFEEREKPWPEDVDKDTISLDSLLYIPTPDEVQRIFLQLQSQDGGDRPNDDSNTEGRSRNDTAEQPSGRTREPEPGPEPEGECPAGKPIGEGFDQYRACETLCSKEMYQQCAAINGGDGPEPAPGNERRPWNKENNPKDDNSPAPTGRTRGDVKKTDRPPRSRN